MPDSIMQRVRQQVLAVEPGTLLTYADLVSEPSQFGAVAAALSRLSRKGLVVRYAKGSTTGLRPAGLACCRCPRGPYYAP